MFKSFLIKYAEIGVKGKNRFLFEDALVDNARRALDKVDGDFKVTKEYGRIYATAENDYDFEDRKSTRLNSSHMPKSRMPSSA